MPNKLGYRELNDCFKMENANTPIMACLYNSHQNYKIFIEQVGYPYLQVYIPPNRKTIALEPQTCIPDSFNNKNGLRYLQPEEKAELKFTIKLSN